VKCTVISSNPEYQRIGEMCVGEHWQGPSLVGVDRLLALKDGDRITIQRALPSGREEEIGIEVKASFPRIISAKVIKAPVTATVTEPVVEAPKEPQPMDPAIEAEIAAEVANEVAKNLKDTVKMTPREAHDRTLRINALSSEQSARFMDIEEEPSPELDATIAKMVDELTSAIRPEDSAVEVESIVELFRHVNDPRHIKRISGEVGSEVTTDKLVAVLVPPIKRMVGLPLMPEHEGRSFMFRFGDEMKLVGDVVEAGILRLKTLYGRGNPVDKKRNSVDITPSK
jgi:hypothetical protein